CVRRRPRFCPGGARRPRDRLRNRKGDVVARHPGLARCRSRTGSRHGPGRPRQHRGPASRHPRVPVRGVASQTCQRRPHPRGAIAEWRLFGPVDVRTYDWEQTYSAVEYTELLQTHSDHRTLPPARLAELLDAVATIIEGHDDELRHPYRTELWLSRSTTQ